MILALAAWRAALGYNWRRNLHLIRKHGIIPWLSGRMTARHAAPGRARRRRIFNPTPGHRPGPILAVRMISAPTPGRNPA